jgi:3-isopropylmalate dehydrogenase
MTRTHRVVVLPGDGIGPEITDAASSVLRAAQTAHGGFSIELEIRSAGVAEYQRTGQSISPDTLAACRRADAVLKGPAGDPMIRAADGTEAGVFSVVLRNALDLSANLRPITLFPGVRSALAGKRPGGIDYVIVRENTEGLYASKNRGFRTPDVTLDFMLMTRRCIERVARAAFELARTRAGAPDDGVRRVTCVDKANVLRGYAYFREVFLDVAAHDPDIEAETAYVDATAARLVMDPGHFDVLVTENLLGDILSDLGGATVGGLGMCPSGNIGSEAACFEPIHGSAPALAGTDRANPISMVLCAAMLLEWRGEREAASSVRAAVSLALADEAIGLHPDGTVVGGTRAAARAICQRVVPFRRS